LSFELIDVDKNIVRSIETNDYVMDTTFVFDGKNQYGFELADGEYYVEIELVDKAANSKSYEFWVLVRHEVLINIKCKSLWGKHA